MTSRIVTIPRAQPSPRAARREALLAWYRPRADAYPWRRGASPYAVLVSEVMLQQTQAPRVVPAFAAFLRRFPDVPALAAASRADVLRAWAGLGYNRRALALRDAAGAIVHDHDARVPATVAELSALPGVGPYTASAVASIAFGVPVAAVDTNARRIVARVVHGVEADELAPAQLRTDADALVDQGEPGAWNQALMDLGREVCRPRPRCAECPLRTMCAFAASGREGRGSVRRQPVFEGSMRQVRGRVVAGLRERGTASVAELADAAGIDRERVTKAVAALARDGLVTASDPEVSANSRVSID
jgi:A/G-specific adenine glycosylase